MRRSVPLRSALHRSAAWVAVVAALSLGVAGCGDDGGDGDDAGDTETTTTATTPDEPSDSASEPSAEPDDDAVVLDITIADGEVTPAGETVDAKVGQQIELRVDSDAEDALHVHSNPEHEFEVKAADGQDFTFTIEQPGQVEIETHETGVVVAELVVTP